MTYHTEKIETAIAKIHECLDAPIDPVRVRRLLKDIGKWSAEAEREAYARGMAEGKKAGLVQALEVLEHDDFATRLQSASVIRALIPEN